MFCEIARDSHELRILHLQSITEQQLLIKITNSKAICTSDNRLSSVSMWRGAQNAEMTRRRNLNTLISYAANTVTQKVGRKETCSYLRISFVP